MGTPTDTRKVDFRSPALKGKTDSGKEREEFSWKTPRREDAKETPRSEKSRELPPSEDLGKTGQRQEKKKKLTERAIITQC
ncbi:hypothetical protein NDU88_002733 [Pleurodeles waltl]|uniref:Uncharacterized protein n=1 Tax=Pleurodeles waltl TaxID=8319 RepID=A0AAV7WRI5_PLEWA|nr:hypothetical protein NDU88_002733 [Pleurodeles waltl]